MNRAAWIKTLRDTPVAEFMPPLAGERVETPKGPGYVVGKMNVPEVLALLDARKRNLFLRDMKKNLGQDFRKKYFFVTVELEDGDFQSYHVWQVKYDLSKDLDGTVWRQG